MRTVNFANVANAVAAKLNVVAAVRHSDRGGSGTSSRLFFGPSAGKKLGKPHASRKHPASSTITPAASGDVDTARTERSYRMLAACQQGRLWRTRQLSTLLPATFALAIAG
jgi:hypothetical protein